MAKPTVSHLEISDHPSQVVDTPSSNGRPRRMADDQTEGQKDMQMIHRDRFQPAFEIGADEALSVPALLHRPSATAAYIAAKDAWQASAAARKRYGDDIWQPAWDSAESERLAAERELQGLIASIPHFTTESSYRNADGEIYHMTTANDLNIRVAMSGATGSEGGDFRRCCRELIRGIATRLAEEEKIRDRFELKPGAQIDPAIDAELKRLEQIERDSWTAFAEFPAVTLGDLVAKTEFALSLDMEIDHVELLADLSRIWTSGPSVDGDGTGAWREAMLAFQIAKEASDNDMGSSEADSLCAAMVDAADRLNNLPAPNLSALEWKVMHLQEVASMVILEPSAFDGVIADVRRLAGQAAAEVPKDDVSKIAADARGLNRESARQE